MQRGPAPPPTPGRGLCALFRLLPHPFLWALSCFPPASRSLPEPSEVLSTRGREFSPQNSELPGPAHSSLVRAHQAGEALRPHAHPPAPHSTAPLRPLLPRSLSQAAFPEDAAGRAHASREPATDRPSSASCSWDLSRRGQAGHQGLCCCLWG